MYTFVILFKTKVVETWYSMFIRNKLILNNILNLFV